ncbi:MAG TPA: hypothetical protein VKN82_07235 [Desulfohalobiaceae bacterium]|nr:hypothetical protein [Desulfohalobiaceae bacterium]
MKRLIEKFQYLLMAATYAEANDRESAEYCLKELIKLNQRKGKELRKENQKEEQEREQLRL